MKAVAAKRNVRLHGGSSSMKHMSSNGSSEFARTLDFETRESRVRCAARRRGISDGSLFPTAEIDSTEALIPSTRQVDPALLLAFHRLHFLTWQERLVLLARVRDRQDFLQMGLDEISALLYRRLRVKALDPARVLAHAEVDAAMLHTLSARFVPVIDPEYPQLLREIYRSPFGLFVRGAGRLDQHQAITMVGTRTPTTIGIKTAVSLASEAAAMGLCVISGLARGIDAAVHRGALCTGAARTATGSKSTRGSTIAVLPCGIDRIYPPSNRGLASDIMASGGLLVSEYPPGVNIDIYRFPERNRILAGLSALTVVIEAPRKSGALITAEFALAEGRELAVAAACRRSSRNAGADALAEDGAPEVRTAADLQALMNIEDTLCEKVMSPGGAKLNGND